ncbi:hypothetical protein PG999_002991 [Apiospora kogelbergensis]|uniref:Glutamine amidotransferase type-2 domain-containing protein n=1 Tax=Apiospora kogelbergensis TaxID=1337665 RepID=A0AAW0RA15_9PEZI
MGMVRLAINDLTPSGDQPLHSDDGSIHCVVNGEIYDFERLKNQLSTEHGYRFRGHSDSEVLVALYKTYGATAAFFERLRGEFAFIIYDEAAEKVIACRDRFGIKPLYWTVIYDDDDDENSKTGYEFVDASNRVRRVLFASEAKAFLPMGWKPEWDVGAIVDGGWYIGDRTPFRGVNRIEPGHYIEVLLHNGNTNCVQYWDADYKNKTEADTRSTDEMVDGIREHLLEAIRLRLRADVPIGIYLSGGIDSALIAGIVVRPMNEEAASLGTSRSVQCFTIQFPAASGFDESERAQRTADWLGVSLTKVNMDEEAIAGCFEDSVYHNENAVFDMALTGKFGLSREARAAGFKVVLSGEGSDEHFAGYPFFPLDLLAEPDGARPESILAQDAELRQGLRAQVHAFHQRLMPHVGGWRHGESANDVVAATPALASMGNTATHRLMTSIHPTPDAYADWATQERFAAAGAAVKDPRDTVARSTPDSVKRKMRESWHPLHTGSYAYLKATMPNYTLAALGDRAEMAYGVEGRPPFLDHHLVAYANGLPPSVKMAYTPELVATAEPGQQQQQHCDSDHDQGHWWEKAGAEQDLFTEKWILRQAARPFVTKEMYARKKHIYSAPTRWRQGGPVHRLMCRILTPDAVDQVGFIDWATVQQALNAGFAEKEEAAVDVLAFRKLVFYASWVTLGSRFGVEKATPIVE